MNRRVVMIAPHFQEYALRLCNALALNGRVTLMLDKARLESEFKDRDMPVADGVSIRNCLLNSPLDAFAIVWRVIQTKAQVLHIQEPSGLMKTLVCILAAAMLRPFCSIILTVHDPIPHGGRDSAIAGRLQGARNTLRRLADGVLVHGRYCEEVYRGLAEADGKRLTVVDHGVILADEAPSPASNTVMSVLCFGRMEAYKGLHILYDAARIVAEKHAPVRFDVAGGGPELDRLEAEFAKLPDVSIQNRFIASSELISLIKNADCVVLPYLSATQSGVLASALANGRFVIASNVGGLPDVIEDMKNGLLVAPGNATELANAIMRAAEDPNLRIQLMNGAINTAHERLCWTEIARQTAAAYAK